MYYSYDANGNQILSRSFALTEGEEGLLQVTTDTPDFKAYEYDLFNRLVRFNSGGNNTGYTYHADGLRKSKTANNLATSYTWDRGNMVAETTPQNTTIYEYDLQGVSRRITGTDSDYYLKNSHGDVVGLYNADGIAVSTYTYDAFGNQLDGCENDTNPFRYCGEYFDAETNNIYLRNRYYDTANGRFITEDPIRDGLNWYVYANNNPIKYYDTTGLFYDEVIEALQTIIDNKSRMDSAGTPEHEYWTAYSNILVAKEQIANDVIYVENWSGVTDVLSPLINGDNNSIQKIKDMKLAVVRAEKDKERQHLTDDVVFTAGLAVVIVPFVKGVIATGGSNATINFSKSAAEHMAEASRYVPVQILKTAIESGVAKPDPQGSSGVMYYIDMVKNGTTYTLEVLYDKVTNTILHFMYYHK